MKETENYKHNNLTCKKCDENFVYFQEETWWDYSGINNVNLVKCPNCGCINAIKYENIINPNIDKRYFEYNN